MHYLSKSLYIYTYGQSGCRQYWSVIAGAPGDSDWENLEMHLEAVIVWTGRCTWRPRWCELGGLNRARLEIHLEDVIKRVWRCTWRPWSSEIGVLGGSQSGGGSSGGRCDGSWDFIHWLTRNCAIVENWVQHGRPRDERLAGSRRQSILGWCSPRCMQYSVYAVLCVNSWSSHGEIEKDDLTSYS